jgi:hypothetical protein
MTDDDKLALKKLETSLIQAMKRKPGTGVRVTIESFVAAAELVKREQAECVEVAGQLYIRQPT